MSREDESATHEYPFNDERNKLLRLRWNFQYCFLYLFKKHYILCLDFLSRTVKKLLAILCFYFWKFMTVHGSIIYSKKVRLLPHISRAHRTLNCSNISYTFWDMTSNVMKISKKRENALLEKNFKVICLTFFSSQVVTKWPLIRFLQ